MGTVPDILGMLNEAASGGVVRLVTVGPATDEAILLRETGLQPEFGSVTWSVPRSYRELLADHNHFACYREFDGVAQQFVLVDEEAIIDLNADLVHLPEDVSREPGKYLSTNHLVGFAEAGDEAAWCFDVTTTDHNGEYPVYYHHQDEPRARYLDGGEWENPADAVPDFPSFLAWFETIATAFTATEPPPWFHDLGAPTVAFPR
jgi:hypothetical protein